MHDDFDRLFQKLDASAFRRRFRLQGKDLNYAESRSRRELADHARQMLGARLFVANPARDGKQTPYRGHPVFVAQHATGTCCRGCLRKWHDIEKGRELTAVEQGYVVDVIMAWMERQLAG